MSEFGPGYVQTIVSDYGDAIALTFLVAAILILFVAVIASFLKTRPIVSVKTEKNLDQVIEKRNDKPFSGS